jgi:hypothetical protein
MLWYRRRSCASGVAREELGGELLDVRGLPQLDGTMAPGTRENSMPSRSVSSPSSSTFQRDSRAVMK